MVGMGPSGGPLSSLSPIGEKAQVQLRKREENELYAARRPYGARDDSPSIATPQAVDMPPLHALYMSLSIYVYISLYTQVSLDMLDWTSASSQDRLGPHFRRPVGSGQLRTETDHAERDLTKSGVEINPYFTLFPLPAALRGGGSHSGHCRLLFGSPLTSTSVPSAVYLGEGGCSSITATMGFREAS